MIQIAFDPMTQVNIQSKGGIRTAHTFPNKRQHLELKLQSHVMLHHAGPSYGIRYLCACSWSTGPLYTALSHCAELTAVQ